MKRFFRKRSFWISAFLLAVAVILVYKVVNSFPSILGYFRAFVSLLNPFIVGIAIAFLLFIPTSKLEKLFAKANVRFMRKHAVGISIALVYLVIVCGITILITFALPALINSLRELLTGSKTYYSEFMDSLKPYFTDNGLLADFVDFKTVQNALSFDNALAALNMYSVGDMFNKLIGIGGGLLTFLMGTIISVYMLADRRHLVAVIKDILETVFKKKNTEKFGRFLSEAVAIFYKYIYSELLDAFIVAVMCTIGLTIMRVPYALALGSFVGIMNLIPYFGAVIAGALSAVLTFFSAGLVPALMCAGFILIMQQIDGNVIQPAVVGSTVGIRPFYVLVAVLMLGGMFGFIGILLGVPIFAVLRVLIKNLLDEVKQRRKKSEEHSEGSDENCAPPVIFADASGTISSADKS